MMKKTKKRGKKLKLDSYKKIFKKTESFIKGK